MPESKKALNPPTVQSVDTGRQDPVYPKPDVDLAPNGFLSPKDVTAEGLKVVVSYQPMLPGDVVALRFNGDDTFVPIKVENQTPVTFWVSVPHIIRALGTTVDIQYTLGGTSAGQKSDILQLTVLPFMEGDLQMAKITEASPPTPGVLDLGTFPEDAELKIAPWPLINAGQTVWLDLKHDAQAGEPYKIMEGERVTAAEVDAGITRSVDRDKLKAVPHGSLITLPLRVNFSGAADETGTISFTTLELSVLQAGGGDCTEIFDKVPIGPVPSPLQAKCLTFTNQSGTAMNMYSASGTKTLETSLSDGEILLIAVEPQYTFNKIIFGSGHEPTEVGNIRCYYADGLNYRDYPTGVGYTNYTFQHDNIRRFEVTLPSKVSRSINFAQFSLYQESKE